MDAVHPDDREFVSRTLEEAVRLNKPYNIDYRVVRSDGTQLYVHAEAEVTYSNAKPIRVVGTVQDITERKKAEKALKESEERYRELVDSSPDAIIVHSDMRLLYANPEALELYGAKSIEHLASHDLLTLVPPNDEESTIDRLDEILKGDKAALREAMLITLDGQEVPIEVVSSPLEFEGKKAVQTIIRDITELSESRKRSKRANQSTAVCSRTCGKRSR